MPPRQQTAGEARAGIVAGDCVVTLYRPDVLEVGGDICRSHRLPPVVGGPVERDSEVRPTPEVAGHVSRAALALEDVGTGEAVDDVVGGIPRELVVARTAVDVLHGGADVVVLVRGAVIGHAIGVDDQVRGTRPVGDEVVQAVAAIYRVIVGPDEQPVLARARAGLERVVRSQAGEDVIPRPARQRIGALVAGERVVASTADEVLDRPRSRPPHRRRPVMSAFRFEKSKVSLPSPPSASRSPGSSVDWNVSFPASPKKRSFQLSVEMRMSSPSPPTQLVEKRARADRVIAGIAEDLRLHRRRHPRGVIQVPEPYRRVCPLALLPSESHLTLFGLIWLQIGSYGPSGFSVMSSSSTMTAPVSSISYLSS